MGLQGLYLNGSDLFGPRNTIFATSSELMEIHKNLFNRAKMFDLIHNHWKDESEKQGRTISKTELRRRVQKKYREASQEEKDRWMRVMKKKRGW